MFHGIPIQEKILLEAMNVKRYVALLNSVFFNGVVSMKKNVKFGSINFWLVAFHNSLLS